MCVCICIRVTLTMTLLFHTLSHPNTSDPIPITSNPITSNRTHTPSPLTLHAHPITSNRIQYAAAAFTQALHMGMRLAVRGEYDANKGIEQLIEQQTHTHTHTDKAERERGLEYAANPSYSVNHSQMGEGEGVRGLQIDKARFSVDLSQMFAGEQAPGTRYALVETLTIQSPRMGAHSFDSVMMCNSHMLCHGNQDHSSQVCVCVYTPIHPYILYVHP